MGEDQLRISSNKYSYAYSAAFAACAVVLSSMVTSAGMLLVPMAIIVYVIWLHIYSAKNETVFVLDRRRKVLIVECRCMSRLKTVNEYPIRDLVGFEMDVRPIGTARMVARLKSGEMIPFHWDYSERSCISMLAQLNGALHEVKDAENQFEQFNDKQ